MQEQKLITQLRAGNPQAVKVWFEHYYPELLAFAQKKAQNVKDAEDLAQETMVNSLRQMHLFRGEASLKTWMMTILRHEIADYYRKKYAKKAIKTLPLSDFLFKYEIQKTSEVEYKVKVVLEKMLDRRKRLLLMKYVDGLSVKEIAQRMDKTFKAVESDLYRARESFKKLYVSLDG
jgi:RNA polymerase sigma-70 factor (ECF subfamily)